MVGIPVNSEGCQAARAAGATWEKIVDRISRLVPCMSEKQVAGLIAAGSLTNKNRYLERNMDTWNISVSASPPLATSQNPYTTSVHFETRHSAVFQLPPSAKLSMTREFRGWSCQPSPR